MVDTMFLLLFLCVLPAILFVNDDFLKFILIIVWCVLVSITTIIAVYLDRDDKE